MIGWMYKRNTIVWFSILSVVVASTSIPSCSNPINIFSDADDIKLGKQIDEEIRKDPKQYPLLKDRPDVNKYVEGIGKKILSSPAITKRGIYAYQFEIIKDDSTINAFCTPGGYIYVYTGLLKFVENEATVAGVIGHEIAHAERRHSTRRITSAYGLQIVLGLVLGRNPAKAAEITANLFTGLGFLANSRSDETEADEYSFKYLSSSEYYPGGIRYFFDKIGAEGKRRGGGFERLLSTHPLPQDRVDHVLDLLAQAGSPPATDANLFASRYQAFKATLP